MSKDIIVYCARTIDPGEFLELLASEGGFWTDTDVWKGYGVLDAGVRGVIWLYPSWDINDPRDDEITEEDERELCEYHTGQALRSAVVIQIGYQDASMDLAIQFVRKMSAHWPCVCVDDSYEWAKILRIPGCYYQGNEIPRSK